MTALRSRPLLTGSGTGLAALRTDIAAFLRRGGKVVDVPALTNPSLTAVVVGFSAALTELYGRVNCVAAGANPSASIGRGYRIAALAVLFIYDGDHIAAGAYPVILIGACLAADWAACLV